MHGECIRIRVEFAVVVETVKEAPVDDHIFADVGLRKVDLVHIDFKLNELLKILWREADINDSLLLPRAVVKVNSVLIHVLPLLIDDIGVKIGVVVLVLVAIFLDLGHEDVSTFAGYGLESVFGVTLVFGDVMAVLVLGILLDMRLVILETECKGLANLLGLVGVEQHDLSFGRKALDTEAGLLAHKWLCAWFGGISLLLVVLGDLVVLGEELLIQFDDVDLSWFDKHWGEELVLSLKRVVLVVARLLEHICLKWYEGELLLVPDFSFPVLGGKSDSHELAIDLVCTVVDKDEEVGGLLVLR